MRLPISLPLHLYAYLQSFPTYNKLLVFKKVGIFTVYNDPSLV